FYLPRIFVNLAMVPEGATNTAERDRLLLMANKLFRFMTPLGVLAVLSGLVLWLGLGIGNGQGWVHAKSLLVLGLIGSPAVTALRNLIAESIDIRMSGIAGTTRSPSYCLSRS
ncbi:MAG: hypothetical protein RLZZ113_1457, partial [Pseudomonadota bacterium]